MARGERGGRPAGQAEEPVFPEAQPDAPRFGGSPSQPLKSSQLYIIVEFPALLRAVEEPEGVRPKQHGSFSPFKRRNQKKKMDLSQELIGKILGKVRELDADGRVRFIALYGSLVEGRGSGLSDIDVALYYDGSEEERFSFRVALQGELGERFDVQIFQDLPLYVRREIVARGKVIFYTDYDFLFNVYLQTLREYSDFERHLRTYYSYLEGAEVEGNG